MTMFTIENAAINLFQGDALSLYQTWDSPTLIISDGPYGVGGFTGDLPTAKGLAEWYEPHIEAWSRYATPMTTLWFWCTEIGWATVHPILEKNGWEYRACHIWDKGLAHIAGNVNSKSLRKLPIVTEVCVQYIKQSFFAIDGQQLTMQEWLRYEWQRTGLPLSKTNEASDVKNAASRKYFTKDHLWYFPPPEAFAQIVDYANTHGAEEGRPYFSVDGIQPLSAEDWEKYRAKFYCPIGVTNVWHESPVNGTERIKLGNKALHPNQKPLKLMELIISISSDVGDLVWEPFGGLFTGAIAAHNLERTYVGAEIHPETYAIALKRVQDYLKQPKLF